MAYTGNYIAFVRFGNGAPDQEWRGLTRNQAKWRYHWIKRNWWTLFRDFREYGWTREWID
jgi:hypothetical protein